MIEERAAELRARAEQLRQLARVPTAGGHVEDQILLEVAERLERRAAVLETLP